MYTVECADCSYSRTEEHGHRAATKADEHHYATGHDVEFREVGR